MNYLFETQIKSDSYLENSNMKTTKHCYIFVFLLIFHNLCVMFLHFLPLFSSSSFFFFSLLNIAVERLEILLCIWVISCSKLCPEAGNID